MFRNASMSNIKQKRSNLQVTSYNIKCLKFFADIKKPNLLCFVHTEMNKDKRAICNLCKIKIKNIKKNPGRKTRDNCGGEKVMYC